jgi:hypothetical protein
MRPLIYDFTSHLLSDSRWDNNSQFTSDISFIVCSSCEGSFGYGPTSQIPDSMAIRVQTADTLPGAIALSPLTGEAGMSA